MSLDQILKGKTYSPYGRVPNVPCVYALLNSSTSECYIGSTGKLVPRIQKHLRDLTLQKHVSKKMQLAWDSHNADFLILVLKIVADKEVRLDTEQYYIDTLSPAFNTYKNSRSGKGHVVSEETRKRQSEALKGRTHSEQARALLSEAHKGKVVSEETRKRQSEAAKRRQPASEHTRKLISEALTGRKRTDEMKARMSKAQKGKIISESTKRLLREVNKGRVASLEEKASRAAGVKATYDSGHIRKGTKCIIQFDLCGNKIREWGSARFIVQEFNVTKSAIYRYLRTGNPSPGGFIWKFKADDSEGT